MVQIFGGKAEGVLGCEVVGAGGTEELSEGPVLVLGVEAAVGAVDQTRDVALAATESLHSS